jgi:hypothetical protein
VAKRDGDPAQLNLLGATTSGVTRQGTTFEPLRLASPDLPDISFFRNRWYDHYSGRWTQEDPIGMAGSVNLYQYAGNNPAAWADPFGLKVCYSGDQSEVQELRVATERATHAWITLDRDNCIAGVEGWGGRFTSLGRYLESMSSDQASLWRFYMCSGCQTGNRYSEHRGGGGTVWHVAIDRLDVNNPLRRYPHMRDPRRPTICDSSQSPWRSLIPLVGHEIGHFPVGGANPIHPAGIWEENELHAEYQEPLRCHSS